MIPTETPLVDNAGDKGQVNRAKKKQRFARETQLNDIRAILATPQGKRVIWRLLEHCKTFESIYRDDNLIYYLSGQQDVGHFLLAEINAADPTAVFDLMKDAATEEKKRNA